MASKSAEIVGILYCRLFRVIHEKKDWRTGWQTHANNEKIVLCCLLHDGDWGEPSNHTLEPQQESHSIRTLDKNSVHAHKNHLPKVKERYVLVKKARLY